MIRRVSYEELFKNFLVEGASALAELDKRPSIVGLLLSPIYGSLYLHLHFGTIDPKRPLALAEFDQPDFREIHFPAWEHEYWKGPKVVELPDGSVRNLRGVGDTEYCRPFVEYFTPRFDRFWSTPERRNTVDWLACEVLGCDPFHIWIPGVPPTDYYPTSIFTLGPSLNGIQSPAQQSDPSNRLRYTRPAFAGRAPAQPVAGL